MRAMHTNLWGIIFKVIEGKMLVKEEVHDLWRGKEAIEQYVEKMLFASSSTVKTVHETITPTEKQFRDGCATRILEIMEQALDCLQDEDRKVWLWRYDENLTLEEVGQMLVDAPKGRTDAGTFFRVKALRTLDHTAFSLARLMWKGGKKGDPSL